MRICCIMLALILLPAAQVGALEVGHTAVTWSDPARGGRAIPSEIYYPANVAGEDVPVGGDPGTRFPVVSFGHGFVMPWSVYSFVWQGLVPAGYIVVLPRTEGSFAPSHLNLGKDLAFVIGAMATEDATPASRFFGRVAATSAVAGHSMGGGASFLAAAERPGITALANLAAAETTPSAIGAAAALTLPALLFAGTRDCVTPPAQHQEPMYEALASSCKTLVEITGASHCQFADSYFLCSAGEGGCQPPTITRDAQHALTLALLLPWLDYQLKGDAAAWLLFRDRLEAGAGFTRRDACTFASVPGGTGEAPGVVAGMAVAPNPFRDLTTITPVRGAAGEPAGVAEIAIYDVRGRCVRRIRTQGPAQDGGAGDGAFAWDGRDDHGRPLPSGLYRIRASSGGRAEGAPVLLLR
jgi:pimeloyl-ACP methyl ester carboxylesterase